MSHESKRTYDVTLTEAQWAAVAPVIAAVRTESPGWVDVVDAFRSVEITDKQPDQTVWVLEEGVYENRGVMGIYATAEAAMASRRKQWKRDEDGVCWHYSGNGGMDDCGWLYPMEVEKEECERSD